LRYQQWRRFYYDAEGYIISFCGSPFLSPLALSRRLFMGKYSHPILRQTRMNPAKGIIIGAFNRLQLNKWRTNGWVIRRFWQLIAIFGKVNQFRVSGNCLLILIEEYSLVPATINQ
jgi:hypothetical protein